MGFSGDRSPLWPDQISHAAACDMYTRERLAVKLRIKKYIEWEASE